MTDASASNQGSFGAGQQGPTVQNDDFNATAFLANQLIRRLNSMKPVKVVKVTPGEGDGDVKKAGTVSVQPLVSQIDGDGNATPHGTVHGIPWTRVQGGKNALVIDPEVDDIGFVVVADTDISAVKASGKVSTPGSRRRWSLSDGVYVPGILNVAPEQYLIFTADGVRIVDKTGNKIELKADGITLTPGGGLPVKVVGNLIVTGNLQLAGNILSDAGAQYPGNLHIGGTLTGDTDVVANGKSLKAHVHSGVTTGGGNSGPNV